MPSFVQIFKKLLIAIRKMYVENEFHVYRKIVIGGRKRDKEWAGIFFKEAVILLIS